MPGLVTYFWFIPTRVGTFDILCFELCGVGHYLMRGSVVVEEESGFREWLREQPTFAEQLARAENGAARVVTSSEWKSESAESGSEASASN